jgi:hypothetical protein
MYLQPISHVTVFHNQCNMFLVSFVATSVGRNIRYVGFSSFTKLQILIQGINREKQQ